MTDQQLLIFTIREAGRIIAEQPEPDGHDATETISRLIAVLDNEVLFGEPLQHRHDCGVGQIALSRECLVDLAHRLGLPR